MSPVNAEELEAFRSAQNDMMEALKARKAALEDALKKKTEQLKALCLQEGVCMKQHIILSCTQIAITHSLVWNHI